MSEVANMTDSERIVALEEHNKSIEQRMIKIEKVVENINSLTVSMERFSVILGNQVEEQKRTNKRLDMIESEPRDLWKNVKTSVIVALITGIITYISSH